MFDFRGLIGREDEFIEKYKIATAKIRINRALKEGLEEECIKILKAIKGAKKGLNLKDAADFAGTSIDSLRRWNKGKNPQYLSQILNKNPDLNKTLDLTNIVRKENFLFLLGIFQKRSTAGISETTFSIPNTDSILWDCITRCFNDCFGVKTNDIKCSIHSKPLMQIIENLTEYNTTIPYDLLETENKKEIYFAGILSNFHVCTERRKRKRKRNRKVTHVSLEHSRGNLIEQTDVYLDEKKVAHSYYSSQCRIRLRGNQCKELVPLLPDCMAKERILKTDNRKRFPTPKTLEFEGYRASTR